MAMVFPIRMSTNAGDPKKKSQLTTASDVLQGLLQNSKSQLSDGFLRWRLEQQWPEVVGGTISEQTLPVAFEKGTLHIWVKHSAWMQQLWFFQDAIKEKVNAHLGKNWVKQVRFTLSRRAATTVPGGSGD
jgi:predicted nucleic acid-binding Zn ribbon protein